MPFSQEGFRTRPVRGSVAISGDKILVAEAGEEELAPGIGSVGVFTRIGTTWKKQADIAPKSMDLRFGSSVSLDGDMAVVESYEGRYRISSVYAFNLACDATYSLPDKQWRQISLPCDPGVNNTVAAVFGDDIAGTYGTDWTVYRYDANGYVPLTATDSLSQGSGYWIIQTSGNEITLDMPDNSTPTPVISTKAEHEPIACLDLEAPKGCFEIPLTTKANSVQWNMIGYPFVSVGSLGDTRVLTDSGSCTSGCDLNVAHTNNIVNKQLWTYNGSAYTTVDTRGDLDPWTGYWSATLPSAHGLTPRLLVPR